LLKISFEGRSRKISGRGGQEAMMSGMKSLQGHRRVWLIFSHIKKHNYQSDDNFCAQYLLHSGGKLIDKISAAGASGYLFDLSKFSPEAIQ